MGTYLSCGVQVIFYNSNESHSVCVCLYVAFKKIYHNYHLGSRVSNCKIGCASTVLKH